MASQSAVEDVPPWSDLLPDLLGRIAARCTKPVDRASFRAVCRSWLSAARHHCPRMSLTPWVLLHDGSFLTLADGHRDLPSKVTTYGVFVKPSSGAGGLHRVPLPENAVVVGSTDNWIALQHRKASTFLYNPFSDTTVPLPGVDAVGAKAPAWTFDVIKVLMRSSTTNEDIIVAVMTRSSSYPFVLTVPGKGTWVPEPHAPPFKYIVDVAFLGDNKLFGITKAEDLFCFDIDDQAPAVTDCKRVIKHPMNNDAHDYVPWSDVDDEDEEEEDNSNSDDDDEEDISSDEEEEELSSSDSEYSSDSRYAYGSENEEFFSNQVPTSVDCWFDYDEEDDEFRRVQIVTIRYLVQSHGKLIMVRRQLRTPENLQWHTRKVEVFEADLDAAAWVPLTGGLGSDGGQALFVSRRFSKCVSTGSFGQGEIEDDAVYFMDTREVFHMRLGTIGPALWSLNIHDPTWLFPPDL
ncbi:hypothetical protein EJB05_57651, partial [Eragrostis curvula]